MEIINDANRMEQYLEQYAIRERFSAKNLTFRLFQFEKGEILTSPEKKLKDLLFLVQGNVGIYHLREDYGISPLIQVSLGSVFGDMEFATGNTSYFYAEALSETLCIALSFSLYEKVLRQDPIFLNGMLRSLGEKLESITILESTSHSLEEKVRLYFKRYCPGGELCNVNEAVAQLHCSRRQLQRILKKMCEEGRIERVKKGNYRYRNQ